MILKNKIKNRIIISFIFIHSLLFIFSFINYNGNFIYYIIFAISTCLLMLSGINSRDSVGYFFITVFFWLGFYCKLCWHLIYQHPFIEPIGNFRNNPNDWDNVLQVIVVAAVGIIFGRLLYLKFRIIFLNRKLNFWVVPNWYIKNKNFIILIVFIFILSTCFINFILGIHQIGLVAKTILPWPLNALIGWEVSIGNLLIVSVILWWDNTLGEIKNNRIFFLLTFESFLSAISLLSRGIFLFHSAPFIYIYFKNRRFKLKSKISLILIFICLFSISIVVVNSLRSFAYPQINVNFSRAQNQYTRLEVINGGIEHVNSLILNGENQHKHLQELIDEKKRIQSDLGISNIEPPNVLTHSNTNAEQHGENFQIIPGRDINFETSFGHLKLEDDMSFVEDFWIRIKSTALSSVAPMLIDRWIGVEGVMSVVSYQNKGLSLLSEAMLEKRLPGAISRYQHISNSLYRYTDSNKWQFAALPGCVAFLYFSGSVFVVLFGMVCVIVILQIFEGLTLFFTGNAYLSAVIGFTMANTIAQFGVTPRQDIPFYLMIFCFIFIVASIQYINSKKFENNSFK